MTEFRYVVLHHTEVSEPHFDLMLETAPDKPLASWRLPDWPPKSGQNSMPIGDHRREYLQHEGEVSENRGKVKRVAAGRYRVVAESAKVITIQLDNCLELSLKRA